MEGGRSKPARRFDLRPSTGFLMTYAFTFDASACSGCKACQEACKDKNNLPVGVMWRRVVEVSGGGVGCRMRARHGQIMSLPTTCPLPAIIACIPSVRGYVPRMRSSTARMGLFTLTRSNVWDAAIARGLARTMLRATTLNWVKWRSVISASIILTRGCLRRAWRLVRCGCLILLK